MTDTKPTIVVEVRGSSRSGVTTLAELIALEIQEHEVPVTCAVGDFKRVRFELAGHLRSACSRVEVREAEPDDRDAELQSLRQERDRLLQEVERRKTQLSDITRGLVDGKRPETLESLDLTVSGVTSHFVSRARYDRLLVAFHDATRRHLGITPASGDEFYDPKMADEAEARRTRHGRGH